MLERTSPTQTAAILWTLSRGCGAGCPHDKEEGGHWLPLSGDPQAIQGPISSPPQQPGLRGAGLGARPDGPKSHGVFWPKPWGCFGPNFGLVCHASHPPPYTCILFPDVAESGVRGSESVSDLLCERTGPCRGAAANVGERLPVRGRRDLAQRGEGPGTGSRRLDPAIQSRRQP